MRFFAERLRDRLAPDAERAEPLTPRTASIQDLAETLHDVAARIAGQSGMQSPSPGLARALSALWSRAHKFDAADAQWPDRDRFVLSHPEGTLLLYGLLHLTGHVGMEWETLNHCGELDAIAAPAAEFDRHAAIEASAAPAGQAIAASVGMALAERVLAARFGKSLVDHRIWCVARADELARGLTEEAAALAGLMRLDRLVWLVDATMPDAEDARGRYLGLGWATKSASVDEASELEAALSFAARSRKPTLIWCTAPQKPPGSRISPRALSSVEAWRSIGTKGAPSRRAWLKRIARHPQRSEFERACAGRLHEAWNEPLNLLRGSLRVAACPPSPADICRDALDQLGSGVPELLCAGLRGALADGAGCGEPGQYAGQMFRFGTRAHGMAACINGVAMHGGTLPITICSFVDAAEQLAALRIAALLGRRMISLATDAGLAAPARAWLPAGLLPALRAIPGLSVFRPGCPLEAVDCLELALRMERPSLLVLSSDAIPVLQAPPGDNRCARGAYVAAEPSAARDATLIATGAELPLAMAARRVLQGQGVAAAVVSLPCWSLFAAQDEAYRRSTLGDAPRFGIEAAGRDGWDRWLGDTGVFLGGDSPAGGPAGAVRARMGLTPERVAASVRDRLGGSDAGVRSAERAAEPARI